MNNWQKELSKILEKAGYKKPEISRVLKQFNVLSNDQRQGLLDFFKKNETAVVENLKYGLAKIKRAMMLGNVRLVKKYLKEIENIK